MIITSLNFLLSPAGNHFELSKASHFERLWQLVFVNPSACLGTMYWSAALEGKHAPQKHACLLWLMQSQMDTYISTGPS